MPPALEELGLLGSLRGHATRLAAETELEIELTGPDAVLALPPAVEVAAYRVASEAMTNVARHARARRCDVIVRRERAALTVEVVDDGLGIPDGGPGFGMRSIRARVGEL